MNQYACLSSYLIANCSKVASGRQLVNDQSTCICHCGSGINSIMADTTLRLATNHCLGKLLPHQTYGVLATTSFYSSAPNGRFLNATCLSDMQHMLPSNSPVLAESDDPLRRNMVGIWNPNT